MAIKLLLLTIGLAMLITSAAIVADEIRLAVKNRCHSTVGTMVVEQRSARWRANLALAFLAWAPIFIVLSVLMSPIA